MMNRVQTGAILGLAWGILFACGSKREAGFDQPFSLPGETADAAAAPAKEKTCMDPHCSLDRKSIIAGCGDESSATLIQRCAPDQGCSDKGCVDACESAEQAKGSTGCSFWTLPPEDVGYGEGSCFVAMIANTWDAPLTISAEYDKAPLDLSNSTYTASKAGKETIYTPVAGPLPPRAVALVFLSQGPRGPAGFSTYTSCPAGVTPALAVDPIAHGGNVVTKAIHLRTTLPVSAYSIYPYGGAKSYLTTATLLLPSSSWSTSHLAIGPWVYERNYAPPSIETPGQVLQIVANEDDTFVQVDDERAAGWTLARGEVLQLEKFTDYTGRSIASTKPVGVFAGQVCVKIPVTEGACDVLQQALPPTRAWGSEYALVSFPPRVQAEAGRSELLPWRIVAAADGTTLTFDPPLSADVMSQLPSSTLSAGQGVTLTMNTPTTVRSQDAQHPLYVSSYMTGGTTNPAREGDPEFVNVVPSDQFLQRYVFFTDFTYANTRLTVVRKKTSKGFAPVSLSCSTGAGEISGFQPLGTAGHYEYAWLDLTKDSTPMKLSSGECGYGRLEAASDGAFSVTVWGTDYHVSYGYPAGMAIRELNSVTLPTPVPH